MIDIFIGGNRIEDIDTVLLDKDGTIIDSNLYWGEIIRRRARKLREFYALDIKYEPILSKSMGLNVETNTLLEKGPVAIASREDVIRGVWREMKGLDIGAAVSEIDEIFKKVHDDFLPHVLDYVAVLPGVIPFMQLLFDKKVKIGVITSDSVYNTQQILDKIKCSQMVSCIVGKETVREKKETGIPAKYALEKLGSLAMHTVCIGDTETDIMMAEQSHCAAGIGVATGQITRESLLLHTEFVVDNVMQIEVS